MGEAEPDRAYPGIDRLHYFLGKVGMMAAAVFVVTVVGPNSWAMRVLGVALMVTSVVLDVMRLRNIGVSQWLMFVRFVPFGRLLLTVCLLCAQPGWGETRRLDRPGRSIFVMELVLLALMIFMFFRMRMDVPFYV